MRNEVIDQFFVKGSLGAAGGGTSNEKSVNVKSKKKERPVDLEKTYSRGESRGKKKKKKDGEN